MKRTLNENVWCLLDEVTVDLIGMASLSMGNDVKDHLQLIVAKSSKPVSELRSGLVNSTHIAVSFPGCLMCLFD